MNSRKDYKCTVRYEGRIRIKDADNIEAAKSEILDDIFNLIKKRPNDIIDDMRNKHRWVIECNKTIDKN